MAGLRRFKVLLIAVVLALAAAGILGVTAAPAPAAAAETTVFDVGDKIMCQCGCGAVLTSCPHQECGWGVPAKQFIGEQLESGRTSGEIVQYYVGQYGEEILAAPTKTGFNITAWVMPFIGLVAGAVAIYYLISLWARRRGDIVADDQAAVAEVTAPADRLERLQNELDEFDD